MAIEGLHQYFKYFSELLKLLVRYVCDQQGIRPLLSTVPYKIDIYHCTDHLVKKVRIRKDYGISDPDLMTRPNSYGIYPANPKPVFFQRLRFLRFRKHLATLQCEYCFAEKLKNTVHISVADPDPVSGAFLTPGSGMGKKNQDPDPG